MTELNLGYIARPQFYDFHTRLERRFVHFAKFLPPRGLRFCDAQIGECRLRWLPPTNIGVA